MKKRIISILLIVFLGIGVVLRVNAADATAKLKTSSTKLDPGETFTVTFEASCKEGINGIQTVISYDEDKLELVNSIAVTDTTKWVKIEGETDLTANILSNTSSNKITSGDVFNLTFKVKDNAERGTTAKVTASGIYIDTDGSETYELGSKEVEISIAEEPVAPTPEEKVLTGIEITKEPDKTTYKTDEKFDKTGMKVTAKYSDGTSKEVTNYTVEPNGALKTSDEKVTVSYTEGGVTKTANQKITVTDGTVSIKKMPYTGMKNYAIIIGISIIGAVSTVSYIKYRKYKNI